MVTTADGAQAAYATTSTGKGGEPLAGSTIYAASGSDVTSVQKLSVPKAWEVRVIAYQDGKVYYRASPKETGSWQLYAWDPSKQAAVEVKTITSPTALSGNGEVAASLNVMNNDGTCSAVTEVATGKRLWKTCEYQVRGFTSDSRTAIGGPPAPDGYADLLVAALDAHSGNPIQLWTGPSFRQTVAEDDEHLLILADDGPDTKASIIRCTITTGACELATPLATGELKISS
jgi:hypothetical protein